MPDLRTNQTVAERLDIKLERRANTLLRGRRWLTFVAGVLPLVFVAVYAARDDQTIYWSRSVSTGHTLIQDDCQKCHRTPWQPLVRLSTLDNEARSVRDEDCQACHLQRSDDHHDLPGNARALACARCHREHQGQRRLAEVADRFCVECHRDLNQMHSAGVSFVAQIDSFQSHPEFEVHRTWPTDPGGTPRLPGKAHAVHDNAEPGRSGEWWSWVDKAALKFSHQSHLQRHLLIKDDMPTKTEYRRLECSRCHEPDAAGHYMKPIVYEDHCLECHPLRFSGKIASDQPLPHESVEIVHGVLRDRLMTYAGQHPDEIETGSAVSPSRLPNKQHPRQPTAKDQWEWVESELQALKSDVFHNPLKNGCLQCHVEETASQGSVGQSLGFAIQDTKIPARWLLHSRFRHDRHRELACTVCHHAADKKDHVLQMSGTPIMLDSKAVQDVLMPSIEVCRKCHGDQHASPAVGRARSGCVECHQYHHVDKSKVTAGRALNDLLPVIKTGD